MMRILVFYFLFIVPIVFTTGIKKTFAKDTLRFIETTGRAVIETDETIDTSRRRALEDALYLAALQFHSSSFAILAARIYCVTANYITFNGF